MLNAVVQMAAVQLELCLTGAAAGTPAAATAAALAAQGFAQSLQTRQLIAQRGKLGLQLALVRRGACAENLQNQHRAVQHFDLQCRRQVADLAAGQFAVKDGGCRVHILADKPRLGDLALTQQRCGLGRRTLLHDLGHGVHAVGVGQRPQLVQAARHIVPALIQRQQHHGQLLGVGGFLGSGAKV